MVEIAFIKRMQAKIDEFFQKKFYDKGIKMLKQYLSFVKDFPEHKIAISEYLRAVLLSCLEIANNIKENETAISVLLSCHKLIEPHLPLTPCEIFSVKRTLAKLYFEGQNFIEAENLFRESIKLSKGLPLDKTILEVYLFYSRFCSDITKKRKTSGKLAKKVLKSATKLKEENSVIGDLQERALEILIKSEIGVNNQDNAIKLLSYASKLVNVNIQRLVKLLGDKFQCLSESEVLIDLMKVGKGLQRKTLQIQSPKGLAQIGSLTPQSARILSPGHFSFKPKIPDFKNEPVQKARISNLPKEDEKGNDQKPSSNAVNKETKTNENTPYDQQSPISPKNIADENCFNIQAPPDNKDNRLPNETEKINHKENKINEEKNINQKNSIFGSQNAKEDNAKEDRFYKITKISTIIQSFVRKFLTRRKFKNVKSLQNRFNGYIAYGRKNLNGKLYFVTIKYEGIDYQNLRKIYGPLAANTNKFNIILDAYPLVSGTKKPTFSCYSTKEITDLLGIWDFDYLRSTLQPALLNNVKIVNDHIEFYGNEKVSDPMKRLIYRGKGKLGTCNYYNIRIYEIIQGSAKSYAISAFTLQQKMEKMLRLSELSELLGIAENDAMLNTIHKLASFLAIENNRLIIKQDRAPSM
ncbi:unnamed protein product [Blepharisma stoltei]|uniref:GIY-YIG homing endonuclease n=1 Tax=Blepharisma stoltei TaxID=1481888 RepID=A0AAU9JDW9_9CILI|nr:unnamed protein product [Blepharisma stoltei]